MANSIYSSWCLSEDSAEVGFGYIGMNMLLDFPTFIVRFSDNSYTKHAHDTQTQWIVLIITFHSNKCLLGHARSWFLARIVKIVLSFFDLH